MKSLKLIVQIFLALIFVVSAHADSNCFKLLKQLEKEKNIVDSMGGIWGLFEKSPKLRNRSVNAIQLDSSINKVFNTFDYICETQMGIPLNDLAIYLSRNISSKGKVVFEAELLAIGKTPHQINSWFKFHQWAVSQKSRKLSLLKIEYAINQSTPLIKKYVELANNINRKEPLEILIKMTKDLNIRINSLLINQPYLVKALNEISHFPYWDTNESTGGS